MSVQKRAEELARAIVNSSEHQRMISAREKVNEHEAAKIMLRDFQKMQNKLHKQQMEGQPVTAEQEEELQNLFGVISVNPYIRELFEAEFAFSGLMLKVNDILSEVLKINDNEEEPEADEPKLDIPKKRILIPGKDI